MSKSFIRNVTMGSLLMIVAMFAATESAQGQSLSNPLRAQIPFDFVVGNKKLPAGEYFIRNVQSTSDSVLAINSTSGVAITLTIPVETGTPTDTAKLIFHRVGDQYFLFQVWQVGTMKGRAVLKSRTERDVERKARLSAPVGAENRKIVETVSIVAYAH